MTVLAISDLHGDGARLERLSEIGAGADLVLVAGDLTDFGGEREARALIDALAWARGRLVTVPGNCDKKAVRDLLEAEGLSADGRLVQTGGARVIGAGGSPLRTGLTPYERRDGELGEALRSALGSIKAPRGPSGPLVVLSHAPPKGSGADRRKLADVGSPALREACERIAPALWVCGHIHESPSAAFLGRTLVLNPGSLREGRYALASLERGADGAWRAEAELQEMR